MGRFQPITREIQEEIRHATEIDQQMLAILKDDTEIKGISGQSNISIQQTLENAISTPVLKTDLHFQVSQIMINNYDTLILNEADRKSLSIIDQIFRLNISPLIKLLIIDDQIEVTQSEIKLKEPNATLQEKAEKLALENKTT